MSKIFVFINFVQFSDGNDELEDRRSRKCIRDQENKLFNKYTKLYNTLPIIIIVKLTLNIKI